jgi:hypothetical protein
MIWVRDDLCAPNSGRVVAFFGFAERHGWAWDNGPFLLFLTWMSEWRPGFTIKTVLCTLLKVI